MFDALAKLTKADKEKVLTHRYPKNTLRLVIGEIVSKDTILKYWSEIENILKRKRFDKPDVLDRENCKSC
ncbi:hypothetical protein [Photobacterium damselae]|uniref:hypothetical protein n=1 Tax=Photobacterium damselae TaxID=38293 RepID=UPI001EFEAD34|nr:hypothetical protein [Photobacterium damselae]MCG9780362.1 hypothetical protein [Photobacterium damselae]